MKEKAPAIRPGSIQIVAVRLVRCSFAVNPDFEKASTHQLPVSIRANISRERRSPTELVVQFGLVVFEGETDAPFHVEAMYEGEFKAKEGDEVSLTEYAKYNALSLLLPYLREAISSMTLKSEFPPMIIPPMNVKKISDDFDTQDSRTRMGTDG